MARTRGRRRRAAAVQNSTLNPSSSLAQRSAPVARRWVEAGCTTEPLPAARDAVGDQALAHLGLGGWRGAIDRQRSTRVPLRDQLHARAGEEVGALAAVVDPDPHRDPGLLRLASKAPLAALTRSGSTPMTSPVWGLASGRTVRRSATFCGAGEVGLEAEGTGQRLVGHRIEIGAAVRAGDGHGGGVLGP
jgi:hypothetical protein